MPTRNNAPGDPTPGKFPYSLEEQRRIFDAIEREERRKQGEAEPPPCNAGESPSQLARRHARNGQAARDGEAEPALELGTLLSTVKAERVDWLWQGRVPFGKLTILDGDPGLGKSVFSLDLAARVTRGLPMPFEEREPGAEIEPAGVVLLSAEDGLADTIRPRLEAAGADVERVLSLDKIPDGDAVRLPALPNDVPLTGIACLQMRAKLVIIDPLTAYLGGETNAHKDQDVRRALHPLAKMAEETGAAVIVIRHLNKLVGGNPLYRGGGSIGIIGAARSGLLVARDPDNPDRRVLAGTKCNLARLPASLAFDLSAADNGALRVGWIGESAHSAESLLTAPRDDEDRGTLQNAVEVLRVILSNEPRAAKDVKREARSAGVAGRTLDRAKAVLGVKSRLVGFGRDGKWHWSLPSSAESASGGDPYAPKVGALCEITGKNAESAKSHETGTVDPQGRVDALWEKGVREARAAEECAMEEGEI